MLINALKSVINQSYNYIEILIINDGQVFSTRQTEVIAHLRRILRFLIQKKKVLMLLES